MIVTKKCKLVWLCQIALIMILLAGLDSTPAWSWTDNTYVNTPISTATNYQSTSQTIADGSGGAIIVWLDRRDSVLSDIYAQKVDSSGAVQWTTNGVVISNVVSAKSEPQIVSDGSGGAIITWTDYRDGSTSDIYAQRINASGVVQWAANGVVICSAASNQYAPQLATDGAGGAIITWRDPRPTNSGLYAQRVNASGAVQWTADGVIISGYDIDPQIIADGSGGAIITWVDLRDNAVSSRDIYAQKVNASGAVQWTVNGVAICTAASNQYKPQITTDGTGGAVIAWYDIRNGTDYNIYTQKVNTSGVVQWTVDGVATCTATGNQYNPQLDTDGSGGAIITWHDSRSGSDNDIYTQRIDTDGAVQWTADGVAVSLAAANQEVPQLVPDGSGGAIITWEDSRSGNIDVYAQGINSSGIVKWTTNGVAISTAANSQDAVQLASDSSGGAIISWTDIRNGSDYDIYAQRIYANGGLILTYAIGGSVSGLATGNSVDLQNNAADDLTVNGDGSFTFATPLADGSAYAVTVLTQPTTPNQTCSVANGSGTLAGADVTNVSVTCVNSYSIGGTVSGLATGNSIELQNNGGDTLSISDNGGYTFATTLVNGGGYVVTVSTQPDAPNQTCTVSNGTGTITGTDVSNVDVTCVTNTYTIGGSVSGLATGNDVELQNNGGDNLIVNGNGSFVFNTALDDESTYVVTVLTQPTTPDQVCTVSNDSGTLAGSNITSVNIACVTTYTVGGTVNGLAPGNGVVLQNNGGDNLTVNTDGSFVFATALNGTDSYGVTVQTQPDTPNQTCTVSNGSGKYAGADITNVTVSCVTNTYTVGGSVSGLDAGNSVVLQNNGSDDLTVSADGVFAFATALDDESTYVVTVLSQPNTPKQTCRINNGTGIISGENIIDVQILCKDSFSWTLFLPAIQQNAKQK